MPTPRTRTNGFLWILQALLALLFGFAGVMKLWIPVAALDTEPVRLGVQAIVARRPRNSRALQDAKTLRLPGI